MSGKRSNFQRIGHFQGQLLTARDLQDEVRFESGLRGLHVRAMHNTWGVALGFEVSVVQAEGAPDSVTVGPGVAYDCTGREILSARTLAVGLPPRPPGEARPWAFDLVVAYDETLSQERGRSAACLPRGAGPDSANDEADWCDDDGRGGDSLLPYEEQPRWRWVLAGPAEEAPLDAADGVRLGEEVPLARFRIGPKGELSAPDFSIRRTAQGLVRPHIGHGAVSDWAVIDTERAAWSVRVDASGAGFTQTPLYFAALAQHPLDETEEDLTEEDLNGMLLLLQGPFLTIRNPSTSGFDLDVRMALPRRMGHAPDAFRLHAHWIGIEMTGGCPPEPTLVYYLYYPFLTFLTATTFETVGFSQGRINEVIN